MRTYVEEALTPLGDSPEVKALTFQIERLDARYVEERARADGLLNKLMEDYVGALAMRQAMIELVAGASTAIQEAGIAVDFEGELAEVLSRNRVRSDDAEAILASI